MRGFKRGIAAVLAVGLVSASAAALACQPPALPPPPPPPLPGETPDAYRARIAAAWQAQQTREAEALREERRQQEDRLWADAPRIFAAAVIRGPRITKQSPNHRQMEVRLRPLAPARGPAPGKPFVLRYRTVFNLCGYQGGDHLRGFETGDVVVLFAQDRKLRYEALLGGISERVAELDQTRALIARARP